MLFLALAPLAVTWSLVNPMLASPDETIHILRAQSIAAGDFSNPFTSDGLPMEAVECLKFQPEVTADCQDLSWGPDGTQQIGPTDGYPPLYHSIAAIPALFTSGLAGAYLMRIWMAVIIMALIAWAAALVSRPGAGPWPLTGVVVAVTPMAIFCVATVNPSGMAVASALLFVVGAVSALDSRWRGREVVAATFVGAFGLALSRRDGLLWLGVLAIVLAPFWIPQVRQLWSRRTARSTWTVVGVAAALVLVAAVWGRPTISRFGQNWQDGAGTSWWEAAKFLRGYLSQVVGVLGWLDSPIGEEALWVALVIAGFLVLMGIASDNRRAALATTLGLVALFVSPVVIGMIQFPYLQGRYLLPDLDRHGGARRSGCGSRRHRSALRPPRNSARAGRVGDHPPDRRNPEPASLRRRSERIVELPVRCRVESSHDAECRCSGRVCRHHGACGRWDPQGTPPCRSAPGRATSRGGRLGARRRRRVRSGQTSSGSRRLIRAKIDQPISKLTNEMATRPSIVVKPGAAASYRHRR